MKGFLDRMVGQLLRGSGKLTVVSHEAFGEDASSGLSKASPDVIDRATLWSLLQKILICLAVLALLLTGAVFLSKGGAAGASRQVASVLAMLNSRSPGQRSSGNLIDSKMRHSARAMPQTFAPPKERALGKIFSPEDVAGIGFVAPYQPTTLDVARIPTPLIVGPADGGGDWFSGNGGSVGPGDGGGDGGGGVPSVKPPPAAVPEPGTWLMMILGLGICGISLRWQCRFDQRSSLCVSVL